MIKEHNDEWEMKIYVKVSKSQKIYTTYRYTSVLVVIDSDAIHSK